MSAKTNSNGPGNLPIKCPRCRGNMRNLGDRSECLECRFTVHEAGYIY